MTWFLNGARPLLHFSRCRGTSRKTSNSDDLHPSDGLETVLNRIDTVNQRRTAGLSVPKVTGVDFGTGTIGDSVMRRWMILGSYATLPSELVMDPVKGIITNELLKDSSKRGHEEQGSEGKSEPMASLVFGVESVCTVFKGTTNAPSKISCVEYQPP